MPIQVLDPMRSRAGQRALPRFFNGPPRSPTDRRYELRIVGGFLSIKGHFEKQHDAAGHMNGGKTIPCLGEECKLCGTEEPQVFEYLGALLDGHADQPVTWCIPPELTYQLGDPPWRGLHFSTWRRFDGTIRIERSRKAAVVIDFPEIDVWRHCLASWRIPEHLAGPRPTYEVPSAADPDVIKLPPPAPKISREEYERIAAERGYPVRKTGGA